MSPCLKILFESTTYYPYGEPTIEPRGQRFLFGGKEREHAAGRNSYDFGARNLAADGTIDGEGAINAAVTVYGPRGENDVDTYIGFTMTSDFEKYGAIADGMYDVMYDKVGKSGMIPSHYAVNGRDFVPCVGGVNPNPGADSKTHKNGVFIHRTGLGGKASGRVSVGCPLILDSHWDRYENQIGKNNHVLIINRH